MTGFTRRVTTLERRGEARTRATWHGPYRHTGEWVADPYAERYVLRACRWLVHCGCLPDPTTVGAAAFVAALCRYSAPCRPWFPLLRDTEACAGRGCPECRAALTDADLPAVLAEEAARISSLRTRLTVDGLGAYRDG